MDSQVPLSLMARKLATVRQHSTIVCQLGNSVVFDEQAEVIYSRR